jgi:hypothetical protein
LEPKLELEDEERIKKVHTKSRNMTPRLSRFRRKERKKKTKSGAGKEEMR